LGPDLQNITFINIYHYKTNVINAGNKQVNKKIKYKRGLKKNKENKNLLYWSFKADFFWGGGQTLHGKFYKQDSIAET